MNLNYFPPIPPTYVTSNRSRYHHTPRNTPRGEGRSAPLGVVGGVHNTSGQVYYNPVSYEYVFYPALLEVPYPYPSQYVASSSSNVQTSSTTASSTIASSVSRNHGKKEYTDEKISFFVSEEEDTLEDYFSDFWKLSSGDGERSQNKNCATCKQPYYNVREIENAELELTCVICMANKKSMVFVDCGHFAVCFSCSKRCKKCPVCSKTSKRVLKVFLN